MLKLNAEGTLPVCGAQHRHNPALARHRTIDTMPTVASWPDLNRALNLNSDAAEASMERVFTIPWFKHDRPDEIAKYANAIKKVSSHPPNASGYRNSSERLGVGAGCGPRGGADGGGG